MIFSLSGVQPSLKPSLTPSPEFESDSALPSLSRVRVPFLCIEVHVYVAEWQLNFKVKQWLWELKPLAREIGSCNHLYLVMFVLNSLCSIIAKGVHFYIIGIWSSRILAFDFIYCIYLYNNLFTVSRRAILLISCLYSLSCLFITIACLNHLQTI